jgi:riboflavin transporter FmnP
MDFLQKYGPVLSVVLFFILAFLTYKVYRKLAGKEEKKVAYSPVRFMARVGIFGAIATILYVVDVFTVKLPFFPSFLSLHFDEIPAFICGYAYGPWAGVAVIGIKTLIKLPFTTTNTVGEFSDFVMSCLYIIPACLIYDKKRNLKGVAIGFALGTVIQILSAMLLNVYVMIPFYSNLYGIPLEGLLAICKMANPAITDVGWSYAFFAVLPFNALKDAVVIVATFLVYRSIHVFLRFDKSGKKKKAPKVIETAKPVESAGSIEAKQETPKE